MTFITRTTTGLVFRDTFQRTGLVVGNDWTEDPTGATEMESNTVRVNGNSDLWRTTPAQPDNLIVQLNATVNELVALWVRSNRPAATTGYVAVAETRFTSEWRIQEQNAGVLGESAVDAGDTHSRTLPLTIRMALEVSGSDVLVRVYGVLSIANLQDLSNDLVLKASIVDTSPIANSAPNNRNVIRYFNANFDHYDEFILCGRNIVVTGLETGWKVQVDARTAVVESGGSVTIDVDTWAFPATTIKVLNGADVEQATLTPSGGIFGGDVYVSAELTGEVQISADVRVIQQNRIFINASIQVSTLTDGEVSADGSINAALQNEIQVAASIQLVNFLTGEVFVGATVGVIQRGQIQVTASIQPAFNGEEFVTASIQIAQRIAGQISAQGSILVNVAGSITDPSGADNRLIIIEHGAQTELPILWRD